MREKSKKLIAKIILSLFMISFMTAFNAIYEDKNALIGLSVFLMFFLFFKNDLGIKVNHALSLIGVFFLGSAIFSYLASSYPYVGIALNFLVILFIMFTFTEQPRAMIYVPFLLMYVFEQSRNADIFDFLLRLFAFIPAFILLGVLYYFRHPREKERNRTLKTVFSHIEIQTERFNIAVKTALTLSAIIFICSLCPQEAAKYAVIIALTVLQLLGTDMYTANIKHPVRPFLLVTIFAVLFYLLIPRQYNMYLFWLFCFVYMFMDRYRIQMVLIAVSAMGAANILLDFDTQVIFRVIPLVSSLMIPVIIQRINFSKICFRFKDKFFPPNYSMRM